VRRLIAAWAASTAATPTARRALIFGVEAPPFRTNCNWETLENAAFVMARGILSVIHRKIAADEVSTHSCILLGKDLVLIGGIGVVLAVVDPDNALHASARGVCFVMGLGPLTAVTKT
jgi:hypothetical protein